MADAYSQIEHRFHVNGYTSIDDWAELVETYETKAIAFGVASRLVKQPGGYTRCTVTDTMAQRGSPSQWFFDRDEVPEACKVLVSHANHPQQEWERPEPCGAPVPCFFHDPKKEKQDHD